MEHIQGIVLRAIPYGDHGLIVDMFTDTLGRHSFATYRTSHQLSRHRRQSMPTWLRPLTLIEFDADIHGTPSRLPYLKGVATTYTYNTLHTHPVKSLITMLIAEFLGNALREENTNPLLFQYLTQSFIWLDTAQQDYANFHLVLFMRMTRFIGIQPPPHAPRPVLDGFPVETPTTAPHAPRPVLDGFPVETPTTAPHAPRPVLDGFPAETPTTAPRPYRLYFDLMNSEYTTHVPQHPYYLEPDEAARLPYMLNMTFANMHLYPLNHHQRQRCLEVILTYYRLHVPSFHELKSASILFNIFD